MRVTLSSRRRLGLWFKLKRPLKFSIHIARLLDIGTRGQVRGGRQGSPGNFTLRPLRDRNVGLPDGWGVYPGLFYNRDPGCWRGVAGHLREDEKLNQALDFSVDGRPPGALCMVSYRVTMGSPITSPPSVPPREALPERPHKINVRMQAELPIIELFGKEWCNVGGLLIRSPLHGTRSANLRCWESKRTNPVPNAVLKVGCFATHLFIVVLAKALAASLPKAVSVGTSVDAKDIDHASPSF